MDEHAPEGQESPEVYALSLLTGRIIGRFEELNAARDIALTLGRQVVRSSANAIRALHRNDVDSSTRLLAEARDLLSQVKEATSPHPALYWAGYVQDAMKEFAEAAITASILGGSTSPTPEALGVEDAPFLNGLAEAASELRRDTLDALRTDQLDRAVYLMRRMDDVYAILVTVDFPDAVTGGLRRSADQLRAVLERTRGDVTVALRQHRLEQALDRAERSLESGL